LRVNYKVTRSDKEKKERKTIDNNKINRRKMERGRADSGGITIYKGVLNDKNEKAFRKAGEKDSNRFFLSRL